MKAADVGGSGGADELKGLDGDGDGGKVEAVNRGDNGVYIKGGWGLGPAWDGKFGEGGG